MMSVSCKHAHEEKSSREALETRKNRRIVHLCIAHVQSEKATTREAHRQWGIGERRSHAINAETMHALRCRDAQRPRKELHLLADRFNESRGRGHQKM